MDHLASNSKKIPEQRFPPPRGQIKKGIFRSLFKSVGMVAGMASGMRRRREENGGQLSSTSATPAETPSGYSSDG